MDRRAALLALCPQRPLHRIGQRGVDPGGAAAHQAHVAAHHGHHEAHHGPDRLERAADASATDVLHLAGAWRLARLAEIDATLRALALPERLAVDASALEELDSAAALALLTHLPRDARWTGLAAGDERILAQVRASTDAATTLPVHRGTGVFEAIGRHASAVAHTTAAHLAFLGAAVVGLGGIVLRPRRLRLRELSAQFEQVCLNALPVVALVTLLIGVVVTYLLGLQAKQYGANIFVVDGVGIGATREFAPIIVAIIVAGRSGAAFTAQLGSMRLTEETDAIRTLGLSPLDVLVLPRVIALMIAMPLLVFVGDVMSLAGGMLIADPMLDITPPTFVARLRDALEISHVYVGLSKAPVFALAIAVIGCHMGMTVERDTRAVGMATTSTVVQSIVSVILLDAAFAVFYQELGI
jgi:phospholipid/cholesterol/gamma-HCH transport system permease protein